MAIANTTIQVRKSGTTGTKPTTLANGELAINFADDKLYYKNSLGNISYFYGANNGPGFATANANNTLILSTLPNDTLSIVPGNNTTITACTTTKTITVNAILDPAFTQANSAFNTANSAGSFANSAFLVANSASSNTVVTQGVDATQNTNIASAQSFANGAFVAANSAASFANSAFTVANSASSNTVTTQGVDATQNTNIASAQSFANSAFSVANTASSNTVTLQGVDATQNTNIASAQSFANSAFLVANSASSNTVTIQGVNLTQNTNIASALDLANSAYNKANTGGTFTAATHITDSTQSTTDTSGALIVDGGVGILKNLNVGGDTILSGALTVLGSVTSANSTVVNYANPYITLHDPSGNTWISSNDGVDIGIEYEYFDALGASYVVLGGSGNGTTATLSISDRHITPVGQPITIAGVTPSGFNGTFIVTASSAGSVSFLNSTSGSVVTTGSLGTLKQVTQLTASSGTWSSQDANVAFTLGSPSVTLVTGNYVTLTGFTPSRYNGTYLIKTSGPGHITYTIGNPNPGPVTVAGQITIQNRHAFSGWANDSGYFEYYKSGNFDATGSFGGLYGGIKAGAIIASPPQSISAADLTAGGFLQVPTKTLYDSTTAANDTVSQVAAVASLGVATIGAANTNVTYTNSATLYIAGAPVAGNNVTMSGNSYSIEVASGKSWFGGDVEFHSANGITFYDGTKQTTNSATYAYSTSGYAQANAAFATANTKLSASGFTNNGVLYANGSGYAVSGTGLTYDATTFKVSGNGQINTTSGSGYLEAYGSASFKVRSSATMGIEASTGSSVNMVIGGTQVAEFDGTGLAIGASSATTRLQIGDATVSSANKITLGKTTSTTEANLPTIYAGSVVNPGAGVDAVIEASSTSGGVAIRTGGSTRAVFDSVGNFGLAGIPSSWNISGAFQIGGYGTSLSSVNGTDLVFSAYYNGGWKYQNATYAPTWYSQATGQHRFYTATTGTVGNPVSFNLGMVLDNNNNLSVANTVTINTSSTLSSTTFTTANTNSNQTIYSIPTATYRSAKLVVQLTSGTSYQVTELLIIHDGTNAFMTQYNDVRTTSTSLGTFDSSITSGNLNLLFTPTNASTTVKLSSSLIVL